MPDPLEDFAHRAFGAQHRGRIDEAMIEVVGAFREARIDALVLKRPVTARWLYAPDEVRGYTDWELLWASRETIDIDGARIQVASEPARAMHLALATADVAAGLTTVPGGAALAGRLGLAQP